MPEKQIKVPINLIDLFPLIHHGMKMHCPVCFEPGTLDLAPTNEVVFKDSIWYNINCQHWECWNCFLK